MKPDTLTEAELLTFNGGSGVARILDDKDRVVGKPRVRRRDGSNAGIATTGEVTFCIDGDDAGVTADVSCASRRTGEIERQRAWIISDKVEFLRGIGRCQVIIMLAQRN